MAKPNGVRLRALRVEADWSTSELAAMLGMAEGSLRNIEGGGGTVPMADRRVHRAARLFTAALPRAVTFEYLVSQGDGDGVPEEPPEQPPPAPRKEPQRKERAGKGPRRDNAVAGAA